MADSLRDQLIKAGFKPGPMPSKSKRAKGKGRGKNAARPVRGGDGNAISLEKAYAMRDREEQRAEQERKRRKMREDARRKAQNDKLQALLGERAQNDPDAEIARHFRDGDRITRIYVTEAQRDALAGGTLGIVKLRRRYLLVDSATVDEAARIKPDSVIDLSDELETE